MGFIHPRAEMRKFSNYVFLSTLLLSVSILTVRARDMGQWETSDPDISAWFRSLKQPDNPAQSCCGFADAYYADKTYARNGKNIAVITDTRDDFTLGRPHVPIGTEIIIPDHKMKFDRGNPTGHSVIFLAARRSGTDYEVYCFVDGNGL
jgi:hypothetical protein